MAVGLNALLMLGAVAAPVTVSNAVPLYPDAPVGVAAEMEAVSDCWPFVLDVTGNVTVQLKPPEIWLTVVLNEAVAAPVSPQVPP
jgi:hypothetical protein